jgi:phospholipase C
MSYYDGNTVTGLWNYAQHYAMSDNFYDTEFGPSTPGALDLISGQTFGGTALNSAGQVVPDPSVIGSPDAAGTGTSTATGPLLRRLLQPQRPDYRHDRAEHR